MVKNICIGLLTVLLIISVIFSLSLNNQIKNEAENAKELENELDDYKEQLDESKQSFTDVLKEVVDIQTELDTANDALVKSELDYSKTKESYNEVNDILESIEEELNYPDDVVEHIEILNCQYLLLEAEIEALKETIESGIIDSNDINENQDVVEPCDHEDSLLVWSQSMNEIIENLDGRIDELEAAISPLPSLSVERIMIQTEIDFLVDLQDDLKSIFTEMSMIDS